MEENREHYTIAGTYIKPGSRQWLSIPVPSAMGMDASHLEVYVARGKAPGPRVFVSAAIHGDELNGIEIIRRLIQRRAMKSLKGMLIAVPVVNIYGLANRSRYLPDGRDLNRCFPGSDRGSLAARLAYVFMQEVVSKCTHGIDLHTAARHRQNTPQIRAYLSDPITNEMAQAFGAPVMLQSDLRGGSIREAANNLHIPTVVYEGGEALRYSEFPIRAGLRGVLRTLAYLGVFAPLKERTSNIKKPILAKRSSWVRAPCPGLMRSVVALGESVSVGDTLAVINHPTDLSETLVISEHAGIVIGRTTIPLVNEGDATLNLAIFDDPDRADLAADRVEAFQTEMTEHSEFAAPVDA